MRWQSLVAGASASQANGSLESLHEPTAKIVDQLKLARSQLESATSAGPIAAARHSGLAAHRAALGPPAAFRHRRGIQLGQSSLANLLAGVESLPTAVISNTRIPTLLYYAHEPEISAVDESGSESGCAPTARSGRSRYFGLRSGCRRDGCRRCRFLDLPGLADPRTRAPVIDLSVHEIDAILWCTVSTQAWKESERSAWSLLPARLRARGLLVSTDSDLLHGARDAEKLLGRLRSEAGSWFRDITLMSSVQALAVARQEAAGEA